MALTPILLLLDLSFYFSVLNLSFNFFIIALLFYLAFFTLSGLIGAVGFNPFFFARLNFLIAIMYFYFSILAALIALLSPIIMAILAFFYFFFSAFI